MKESSLAEFAQFRFVRDSGSNLFTLPAQGIDERLFLVLDCERYRFGRLHIFERAALREEILKAFEEEMEQLANVHHSAVSRLISWGRDEDELFYADEMRDGEPLPAYLGRTGGISFRTAAKWVLFLLEVLETEEVVPPSLERFSNINLQVGMNRLGEVLPFFSEYHAWTHPGVQVHEHPRVFHLAQVFCCAIVGVPSRVFSRESLPRNFEELNHTVQSAVLMALDEAPGSESILREAMVALAASEEPVDMAKETQPPESALIRWLSRELNEDPENNGRWERSATYAPYVDGYAITGRIRGLPGKTQIFPGEDVIPRKGWFPQHYDALRRPGRGMVNQLSVLDYDRLKNVSLIGEEIPTGVDLWDLVKGVGTLSWTQTMNVFDKIIHSLDQLEDHANSCSVWWLPPDAVHVVTGTQSRDGSARLLRRKGEDTWAKLPLRLRLHQTVDSLRSGVDLPDAVIALSHEPGRKYKEVRRSAIFLHLLWFVRTGERFRWYHKVREDDRIPVPVRELMEKYRKKLSRKPETVETCFTEELLEMDRKEGLAGKVQEVDNFWNERVVPLVSEPAIQENKAIEPDEKDDKPVSEARDEVQELRDRIGSSLFTEKISLTEEPEGEKKEEAVSDDSGEKEPEAEEEKSEEPAAAEEPEDSEETEEPAEDEAEEKAEEKAEPEETVTKPTQLELNLDVEPEPEEEEARAKDAAVGEKEDSEEKKDETDEEPEVTEEKSESESEKEPEPEEKEEEKPDTSGEEEAKESEEKSELEEASAEVEEKPADERSEKAEEKPDEPEPEKESEEKAEKEPAPSDKPEAPAEVSGKKKKRQRRKRSGWFWIVPFAVFCGSAFGFVSHSDTGGQVAQSWEGLNFPITHYEAHILNDSPLASEFPVKLTPADPASLEELLGKAEAALESQRYAEAVTDFLAAASAPGSGEREVEQLWATVATWVEKSPPVALPLEAMVDTGAADALIGDHIAEALADIYRRAEEGDAVALRMLGWMSVRGKWLPLDAERGRDWLEQAAEKNDRLAQLLFAEGAARGLLAADAIPAAMEYLQRASDSGDAAARYFLGVCLIEGENLPADMEKAFELIASAVEKGHHAAIYQLGLCHANGLGAEPDALEAVSAFRQAADLGGVNAMVHLARCLEAGVGESSSSAQARLWMKKAALLGSEEAANWCRSQGVEL